MRTDRIQIGGEYAVNNGMGLCLFRVVSIMTIRRGNGPNDTTSLVRGLLQLEGGADWGPCELEPDKVLGPYQQYTQLVEQRAREHREREERVRLARELRDLAVLTLRNLLQNDGINANLDGVRINDAAMPKLLELLDGLKPKLLEPGGVNGG